MKKLAPQTQSRLLCRYLKAYNFQSNKQRLLYLTDHSAQDKNKYIILVKELIRRWLQCEDQFTVKQKNNHESRIYSSLGNSQFQNVLNQKKQQYPHQINQYQKANPLSKELIQFLYSNHYIFKRINFNLAQTMINIGSFSVYKKNQEIPFIFYEDRHKNQCNQRRKLGVIMYGRLRLYNKANCFQKWVDETDCIGQHGIQTLGINFTYFRDIKVRSVENQTAILWIKKHHYEIFFKQSIKCGLKQEIKKLQSHLKMSWIKKSIKKI